MTHLAGIPDRAPTLEEWAAQVAASGRNYTDRPVGSTTGSKRAIDAELSAIVTETLGYTPPPKSRERAPDRPQSDEQTERVHRDHKKHSKPGRAE